VGFGHWGPNLARSLSVHPTVRLAAIAEVDHRRRADAVERYPQAVTVGRGETLVNDPTIDALAIATPASSHFALASAALRAGKHVFVEKPMATCEEDAESLVEAATRQRLVLMVDHTFLFTSGVARLIELVETGELGTLRYCAAERLALGRSQRDVSVLWDLAVHDLAILDRLIPEPPEMISVHGVTIRPRGRAEVAFLTARYANDFMVRLHVTWLSPVKSRRLILGGSRGTALWNASEASQTLEVCRAAEQEKSLVRSIAEPRSGNRPAAVWQPRLDQREPLAQAIDAFATAIADGRGPALADGASGLRVVRQLVAAEASLAQDGAPIALEDVANLASDPLPGSAYKGSSS